MFKEDSLLKLLALNLNVHKYSMLETLDELLEYQDKNPEFSIRFDSAHPKENLPFYTFKNAHYHNGIKVIMNPSDIIFHAKLLDCKLLCSEGHKYDDVQICNYVYKLDPWYDFILELSFWKSPLRRMYDGTTIIIKGNLYTEKFEIIGDYTQRHYLSRTLLYKILTDMHSNSIYNKWCECTIYPKTVGLLDKEVIYWQII